MAENKCPREKCYGCRHYSPEFKIDDESGRKCALAYYLIGGMALEAVGDVFGITRERIRQIEANALNKLKHFSRLRVIREFAPEAYDHSEPLPAKKIKSGTTKGKRHYVR